MDVSFTLDTISEAAAAFIKAAGNKKVIAFEAPMGAGKTTFIHAVCEALGVKNNISSPTFSIINQYSAASGAVINHIDLYRLKDEEEAINAGVEDALYSGNLCLVEWPNVAPGLFADDTLFVKIETRAAGVRKLKFNV